MTGHSGVTVLKPGDNLEKEARTSMAEYYAHTAGNGHPRPSDGRGAAGDGWQLLSTHLRNVADLAGKFAEPLGLPAEAKLAGLLHDLGKYRDEFQQYLRN